MRLPLFLTATFAAALAACGGGASQEMADVTEETLPDSAESLVVAGGCFWCVESDMEAQPGVYEAVSGYAGGDIRDATYRNHEGHREVAEVWYNPEMTDYGTLVRTFLRTIDVTDAGGQFCDRGHAYTTAIHYRTEEEREIAEAAVAEAEEALGREIVTPVEPLPFFVRAEDYHQDYYKSDDRIASRFGFVTKAEAYKGYRKGCGRDARVKEVWGDAAVTH